MTDRISNLASLHTALIDSRNGYDEAFVEAEGKGLSGLFREMMSIHKHHSEAVASYLKSLDQPIDENGSFMTTVNRTVISVRSLFGGLDESVLPGLIDGEERIVKTYDTAIATSPPGTPEHEVLVEQRRVLQSKIAEMMALRDQSS